MQVGTRRFSGVSAHRESDTRGRQLLRQQPLLRKSRTPPGGHWHSGERHRVTRPRPAGTYRRKPDADRKWRRRRRAARRQQIDRARGPMPIAATAGVNVQAFYLKPNEHLSTALGRSSTASRLNNPAGLPVGASGSTFLTEHVTRDRLTFTTSARVHPIRRAALWLAGEYVWGAKQRRRRRLVPPKHQAQANAEACRRAAHHRRATGRPLAGGLRSAYFSGSNPNWYSRLIDSQHQLNAGSFG